MNKTSGKMVKHWGSGESCFYGARWNLRVEFVFISFVAFFSLLPGQSRVYVCGLGKVALNMFLFCLSLFQSVRAIYEPTRQNSLTHRVFSMIFTMCFIRRAVCCSSICLCPESFFVSFFSGVRFFLTSRRRFVHGRLVLCATVSSV